jgi:hypothetical protein
MNTVTSAVNAAPTSRRIGRSAAAVAAGLATIFAVTTAADLVMHATGVFPPQGRSMTTALFLLALGYRLVIDVGGCYLAAWLAPDRPRGHALVLGTIGLVLSAAGALAMWNAGPHWYPMALFASSLPSAWVGGRLRERQLGR